MNSTMQHFFLISAFFLLISCGKTKGSTPDSENSEHEILGTIPDPTDTITMEHFIGANGFIDDPVDKLAAVGFIREYHNWGWDEGNWDPAYKGFPQNQIQFAPSYPGWSFDEYYANLKRANIMVAPCVQGSVSWLQPNSDFKNNKKPTDYPGFNTSDPHSYYAKSSFMYQFAARYGNSKVPDSTLLLAPNQSRVSGLGLIKYVEDWNEQDMDWNGPDSEFSPEEYAAMASADYDGHCNTMKKFGKKYGVKNADPSIKLVMGGLASLNLNYIKKMKTWFEQNRNDKKFAVDVLNFHIYAFKDGSSWQGGGPAISPEDAGFREKLAPIVRYRNEHLPGKEVWVSEFGWDTNPESVLSPPAIGSMDTEEVQGIWLIRAYMAFAAAGVDRAQTFVSRDGDPHDKTWFSSSGLMGPKGDFTPKKSWYYVATLKNTLTNMRYIGWETSADPDILIYKFKDIHSSKGAYVLWAKTSKDYKVSQFPLQLSEKAKNASLRVLVRGKSNGDTMPVAIDKQKVFIDVSEKPVFVLADHID